MEKNKVLTDIPNYQSTKEYIDNMMIVDINRSGHPVIMFCNVEVGTITISGHIMEIRIFTNIWPFSEYLQDPDFFLAVLIKLFSYAESYDCYEIKIVSEKNLLGTYKTKDEWQSFIDTFTQYDDIKITF